MNQSFRPKPGVIVSRYVVVDADDVINITYGFRPLSLSSRKILSLEFPSEKKKTYRTQVPSGQNGAIGVDFDFIVVISVIDVLEADNVKVGKWYF